MAASFLGPLAAILLLCFATGAAARGDVASLVDALEAERIAQSVPGLGVTLVSRDRVLWAGGLGVMDLRSRRPVTHETLFRIGSVTKIFTALALLQLQEEGRLMLEDPVRRHAPDADFRNDWESTHPLTIAMLLEHTAGLHDLTQEEFDHNDPVPLPLERALAVRPDARVARWKPGLHASYSNVGYALAGRVIERVTEQPYEEVIGARLLAPLGMRDSGFFLSESQRDRLATGYAPDGREPLPYWHMLMRPFGGIHTTPRDMAPFLRMLLGAGRIDDRELLTASSLHRAERPSTTLAARAGVTFGYGLGLNAHVRNGVVMHGHSGDADGYLSYIGYSSDLNLAYFISINRFQWPALRALRRVVEDWITRGHGVAPPAPAKVSAETLQHYVGRYRAATRRFDWDTANTRSPRELLVELRDGILYTRSEGGGHQALIPLDPQRFRREDEPCATSAFARDEDGRLYFQEDDAFERVEP